MYNILTSKMPQGFIFISILIYLLLIVGIGNEGASANNRAHSEKVMKNSGGIFPCWVNGKWIKKFNGRERIQTIFTPYIFGCFCTIGSLERTSILCYHIKMHQE